MSLKRIDILPAMSSTIKYILLIAVFISSAAKATKLPHPGTICVESFKSEYVVDLIDHTVFHKTWGEKDASIAILNTEQRHSGTTPVTDQTIYTLKRDYVLYININNGETRGTGFLYKGNQIKVEYEYCYHSDNIDR